MKNFIVMISILFVSLLLVSCVDVNVDTVESLEIVGWNIEEHYGLYHDDIDLTDASVIVTFTDGSSQTVDIQDEELILSGTGSIVDGYLKTDVLGSFFIKVAFGGASVTVNYEVVEHLVRTTDSLVAALDPATNPNLSAGDTVYIASGNHFVSEQIDIDTPISIIGSSIGESIITLTTGEGSAILFNVTSNSLTHPITISDLTLYVSGNVTTFGGMIRIAPNSQTGTITITNNIIRGTWASNILFFNLYSQGIEVNLNAALDIVIENNEIFNLRTGIQILSGTVNSLRIANNNIFHTKGGILSRGTYAQQTGFDIDGNTWDSNSPGNYLSHNEWDYVFFGTTSGGDITAADIQTRSSDNNGAYILFRPASMMMNRSHAFIVLEDDLANFKATINPHAFKTTNFGWNQVATPAGYVSGAAVGESGYFDPDLIYDGDLLNVSNWYTDPLSGAGGDKGGNRDFYWKPMVTSTVQEGLDAVYDAVVYQGVISVWNSATMDWDEQSVDWEEWAVANGYANLQAYLDTL